MDEQEEYWLKHVEKSHAQGRCEFSGALMTDCVNSICDCFCSMAEAEDIERKAGVRT